MHLVSKEKEKQCRTASFTDTARNYYIKELGNLKGIIYQMCNTV